MANEARTTRIRFSVSLDIDVDDWNLNYGTETVREVQRDVREYLMTLLKDDSDGGLGLIKVVD